ncbi:MAG: hypothetical protein COY57_04855 [Flavobacteriales bacterium CG_4_10_14_0_8_um_filter_32_5]|nr:MAG: hypothetical protein COY57_04855 [Flavobacteriales bacterium CG_4_10_14_0_8_um_filter_32_5]
MKKLLLGLIILLATTFAFGQSNRAGIIQAGLGGGIALGWASVEFTNLNFKNSETQNGVGVAGNFNIRGQYGISKSFSAGILLRKDVGVFSVSKNDFEDSFDMSVSTFSFGFEGKIYLINKDKFNLNIAPSFGYTTGSTKTIDYNPDLKGDASGLNYGLTTGINLYFGSSSKYGMSADIGFAGSSLSGSFDGDIDNEYKIKRANFYIGLGFSTRF